MLKRMQGKYILSVQRFLMAKLQTYLMLIQS